jgi:hypothetical protein
MNRALVGWIGVLIGLASAGPVHGAPKGPLGNAWPAWQTSPLPQWDSREAELVARLGQLNAEKARLDLQIAALGAGAPVRPHDGFGGARIRRYSCNASGPIDEAIASCDGTVILLRRRSEGR